MRLSGWYRSDGSCLLGPCGPSREPLANSTCVEGRAALCHSGSVPEDRYGSRAGLAGGKGGGGGGKRERERDRQTETDRQ